MNGISSSSYGSPYNHSAYVPDPSQWQANQFALNQEEAQVLAQLMGKGLLSTAIVSNSGVLTNGSSPTNVASALPWYLGLAQQNSIVNDQDRTLNGLSKFSNSAKQKLDEKHHNTRYVKNNGTHGKDLQVSTAEKNGGILLDKDGNPIDHKLNYSKDMTTSSRSRKALLSTDPEVKARTPKPKALFKTDLATVDVNGDVNQYAMRNRKFGSRFASLKNPLYDGAGTFGDSLMTHGSNGKVTAVAREYGNELKKFDDFKAKQTASGVSDSEEALTAKKQARNAEIQKTQKKMLEVNKITVEEAGKDLQHKANIVEYDKKELAKLEEAFNKKPGDAKLEQKVIEQKARLSENQKLLKAQQKHFTKLNQKNAQLAKGLIKKEIVLTQNNVSSLVDEIHNTKANLLQKGANLGNTNKATTMALHNKLKNYGLDNDQIKQIQNLKGDKATLQNALKNMAEDNLKKAKVVSSASKLAGTQKLTKELAEEAGKNLDDAVAKSVKGSNLRQAGNIMGKATKGLAVVGTVLEVANLGVNLKNGDDRKAASDLTSSILTGVGTTLLAGAMLSGVGTVPALLATALMGGGLNAVITPVVDKVFSWFGLKNSDEKKEEKANADLSKLREIGANAN